MDKSLFRWLSGTVLVALLTVPAASAPASPLRLAHPFAFVVSVAIDWTGVTERAAAAVTHPPSHATGPDAQSPGEVRRPSWAEATRAVSAQTARPHQLISLLDALAALRFQLYIEVAPQLRLLPLTDRLTDGDGGVGFRYEF